MFFLDLVCALFIGLILTVLFTGGLPRRASWVNFWFFFIIVALAAWAGGVWITPIGASRWGVYWLSFLIVGLIFALVLASSLPRRPPQSRREAIKQTLDVAKGEKQPAAVLGIFFWILVAVLLVAIISHYVF